MTEPITAKFSKPQIENDGDTLYFVLETSDGRYRECTIELENNNESSNNGLFVIRANDHVMDAFDL